MQYGVRVFQSLKNKGISILLWVLFILLGNLCKSQTANFQITTSSSSNCPPLTVTLSDSSYGGQAVSWDWTDGSSGNFKDTVLVKTQYNTSGTYPITLVVTFKDGQKRTVTKNLEVNPIPVAAFTATPKTGCTPLRVQFSDASTTSTGTITNWVWKLDNQISIIQNPSQIFSGSNNYEISLFVTNSWGCKSVIADTVNYIKVDQQPLLKFIASPGSTCMDSLTVNLTNTSTNATNYSWDFGDNTTSSLANPPPHLYNSPNSSYIISLKTTAPPNCNAVGFSDTINLGRPKAAISTQMDTVCLNNPVNFSSVISPSNASANWYFGNSNIPYNGNNLIHSFSAPGFYNIVLVASNAWGCADSAKSSIYVKPAPVPSFSIDTLRNCDIPFTVHTTNLTAGTNLTYTWNFGDNSGTFTGTNPSHTYKAFGVYSVTLTAKDTFQTGLCNGTLIKVDSIRIFRPFTALHSYLSANCGTPVDATFNLDTLGFINAPTGYIWDFGDNGSAITTSIPSAKHTYTASGAFKVKVTVVAGSGCSKPDSTVMNISDTCNYLPIITRSCTPCNIITIKDTLPNTVMTSVDFGDSVIINGVIPQTITHTYPLRVQDYTVKITRKDNAGNVTYSSFLISIVCLSPGISANKDSVCISDLVKFRPANLDSLAVNAITKYVWNFGDATGATLNRNDSVQHGYGRLGTYPVSLTVTDRFNCQQSSGVKNIVVKGPHPAFSISPQSTCDSLLVVSFTDSSVLKNNVFIKKWIWNYGDGSLPDTMTSGAVFSRTYKGYQVPQTVYYPSLTIIDSLGCMGVSLLSSVVTLYKPKADFFSADTLHCGATGVNIFNNSSAVNPIYTWDLGDGTITHTVNVSHVYPREGFYTNKLIVQDKNGCMDSVLKPQYIKVVRPIARMTISDTAACWPSVIFFTSNSDYANGYSWNFGDQRLPATIKDPPYYYNSPGFYKVTLTVGGPNGCKDSTSQTVHVKGSYGTVVIDSPYSRCMPDTVTMRLVNKFNITSYSWNFRDGTVVNSLTDSVITHVYKDSGSYLPNIIFTSSDGCSLGQSAVNPVFVDYAKASFTVLADTLCARANVVLSNGSITPSFSSLTDYSWNFGNNQFDRSQNPNPFSYNSAGTYNIGLSVKSKYGCISSYSKPVTVFNKPTVLITGSTFVCQNSSVIYKSLINSADSISGLAWQIGGSLKANTDSFLTTFSQAGTTAIEFSVSTKHGCILDTIYNVQVNPLPLPNASPDTSICIDRTALLRAYNGISYQWSPAATLSSSSTAFTLANPPVGTTKYFVTVTDALGCKGYDSVSILKQDSIFLIYNNSAEICLGNDFKVVANSDAHSFQWLPATGVSDPSLLHPVLSPLVSTDYQLTAYSNNACPNKVATVSVKVDPLPNVKATAQYTPVLYPGQIVTLDAVGSADVTGYLWQSNRLIANPTAKTILWNADTTRTFKITVHNQYNCVASDSITVDVFCYEGNIYLPTSFTPNGDGKNDYFRPLSSYKTNSMVKKFMIFNRWGQVVYSIHDMPIHDIQGWNGNFPANTNQTPGSSTYVWYMEFTCNGAQSSSKGTVVLIK